MKATGAMSGEMTQKVRPSSSAVMWSCAQPPASHHGALLAAMTTAAGSISTLGFFCSTWQWPHSDFEICNNGVHLVVSIFSFGAVTYTSMHMSRTVPVQRW